MPILPALSDTALGNTGSMDLTPKAPTALDDIQKGATINSTNASTQKTQLDMQLEKLSSMHDILGSVINAAPDAKESAYQSALQQYKQIGGDISKVPPHYDEGFVTTSAMQSDKALKMMMAMKEFAIMKKNLQNQTQTAAAASGKSAADLAKAGNADAANQQLGAATGALDSVKALGQDPADMAPGLSALATGQPQAPGAPPQQQPAPDAAPTGQPPTPGAPPKPNFTPMQGPAELANQTKQAEEWQGALTTSGKAAGNFNQHMAILNQADNNLDKGIPTGKYTGSLREALTPGSAQELDKLAAQTMQDSVKQLAQSGVGRIMQSELGMIKGSTFGNDKQTDVDKGIIKNGKSSSIITEYMTPIVYNDLDKKGLRNRSDADLIIATTARKMGLFDVKNGTAHPENMPSFETAYHMVLQEKGIEPKTDYINSKGKIVSLDDLEHTADKHDTSIGNIISKTGIKPVTSYTNPASGKVYGKDALDAAAQKSGMSKNDLIKQYGLVVK